MFSATSWVLKKWSFNFNIICQVTLWTPIGCSLTFVMFYITRRNRRKSFLHWKDCLFFFQKIMFSATSWVLKKWSYNFNINCQVTLWTRIRCSPTFDMFCDTRRNRRKSILHWKVAFFFKNLCIQQPLGSWRNGLLTSTLIVKLLCGPLQVVVWRLSCSIIREEIGHNLFFTGKIAFFFKHFCFSATSWVLKKWSYNFNINCQFTLWTPIRCSPTFVMFCNTRRNRRKSILHWKCCLFLQKFMYSATSWVLKKWSFNFNINCQVTFWTPIRCSPTFIMFCDRGRNRRKSILHWKVAFFFKNLCIQQPLGSWRNGLLTSTLIVRLPFGPLQVVVWRLSCSIIREEIGHNLFFTGEISFFSKIFVFNILEPKNMILYLQQ